MWSLFNELRSLGRLEREITVFAGEHHVMVREAQKVIMDLMFGWESGDTILNS